MKCTSFLYRTNLVAFLYLLPQYKLTVNALNALKIFLAINER